MTRTAGRAAPDTAVTATVTAAVTMTGAVAVESRYGWMMRCSAQMVLPVRV